jgi:hypothetical protein
MFRWQRLQPRNYPGWQQLISSFFETQFISTITVEMNPLITSPYISIKQHCPGKMLRCKICETDAVSHGSSSDLVLTSFYVHQLHIEDESWVLWYLPHSFAPVPGKGESGSTKGLDWNEQLLIRSNMQRHFTPWKVEWWVSFCPQPSYLLTSTKHEICTDQ